MHKLVLVVYLSLVLAVAAVAADSHKQPPRGKPDKQQIQDLKARETAGPRSAAERAEREREAAEERAESAREEAEEAAERDREAAEERAESEREQAEEAAERERERVEDREGDDSDQGMRGAENAAARGNEKSREMRSRRDERKEIMGEYRDGERAAAESDDDAEQEKAKKPWWKFWGD